MDKLRILAFGAHPDDVELGCGGILAKHAAAGDAVGIADLTLGQMGTRGSIEGRLQEAAAAGRILGLALRTNLEMEDGLFENDHSHRLKVIQVLRRYRPDIVICNAPHDRHPDHGRAAALVKEASFYAGLAKIETRDTDGNIQTPWRPKVLFHYIQFYDLTPDVLVDISDVFEQKMESILAHRSQFYDPASTEPQTLIASPEFLDHIRFRAANFGLNIGVKYAEGLIAARIPGLKSLNDIL